MNDAQEPDSQPQEQPLGPDVFASFKQPGDEARQTMQGVARTMRRQKLAFLGAAFSCLLIAMPALIWALGLNQAKLLELLKFAGCGAFGGVAYLVRIKYSDSQDPDRPGMTVTSLVLAALGGAVVFTTMALFGEAFRVPNERKEHFHTVLVLAGIAVIVSTLAGWFLGGLGSKR